MLLENWIGVDTATLLYVGVRRDRIDGVYKCYRDRGDGVDKDTVDGVESEGLGFRVLGLEFRVEGFGHFR